MSSASQPFLFSVVTSSAAAIADDAESTRLLAFFRQQRLMEGSSAHSVDREVSQLRALWRGAKIDDERLALADFIFTPRQVATQLLEPVRPIAQSTGRARLNAVCQFIRIVSPRLGRDARSEQQRLDHLLPQRSTGWHTLGTVVGGDYRRRRSLGPTVDPHDLERLVDTAGASRSRDRTVMRDRAILSLACFTGLRPGEIVKLRWEDLSYDHITGAGHFGLTAQVSRRGQSIRLILAHPAANALVAWADLLGCDLTGAVGPVFSRFSSSMLPMSYRTVRQVIDLACRQAGFPPLEAAELRAACAWWLKSRGLSDHAVAEVLGLARVKSVDELTRRHAALQALRTTREHLPQLP